MKLWRHWVRQAGFIKEKDELPTAIESRKKGGESDAHGEQREEGIAEAELAPDQTPGSVLPNQPLGPEPVQTQPRFPARKW